MSVSPDGGSGPGGSGAGTGSGGVGQRLAVLLGTAVPELRSVGGANGVRHYRAVTADGRTMFVKAVKSSGHAGPLNAEAAGLRWLADAAAVPVPEVLAASEDTLAIAWVPSQEPDRSAAARFGHDLARLHAAGAPRFGAPWPGYIAGLPLPNGPASPAPAPGQHGSSPDGSSPDGSGPDGSGPDGSWPDWYVACRVLPYLRRAVDAGTLSPKDARLVESAAARASAVAGPAEPPSRIHGDCWSGNVLWSGGRGWLIDPAAHGGHRETDLAMLALFGAPYLARIVAAYNEAAPLAAGWRDRVPLHQLHPLLVHVCLFGSAYASAALAAARAILAG